ncbi:hypothetical protein MAR_011573 [Mya arenaria]|uniref:ATP synthase F0 subunit 8 n=1 Tax=Mya arenaria TaxID=6604 RepID=A0ABY7FXJ3_MYAAR|nr:hypothetical protein MAR_011573 [Mya arenaria]
MSIEMFIVLLLLLYFVLELCYYIIGTLYVVCNDGKPKASIKSSIGFQSSVIRSIKFVRYPRLEQWLMHEAKFNGRKKKVIKPENFRSTFKMDSNLLKQAQWEHDAPDS